MNYLGMYHAVWSNFIPQNHLLFHNILHHSWCPAAAFIPHSQNYAVKWDIAHLSFNSYSVNHAEKWDFVFSNVVNFSWWLSVQSRIQNLWPPSSLSTPPPPPPPPLCLDMLHEFTIVRLSPPPPSCPVPPPHRSSSRSGCSQHLSWVCALRLARMLAPPACTPCASLLREKKKKKKKKGGETNLLSDAFTSWCVAFWRNAAQKSFFPLTAAAPEGGNA